MYTVVWLNFEIVLMNLKIYNFEWNFGADKAIGYLSHDREIRIWECAKRHRTWELEVTEPQIAFLVRVFAGGRQEVRRYVRETLLDVWARPPNQSNAMLQIIWA